MSDITLEAEAREDLGKGASRRLRRLEGRVPAIIYGGSKEPVSITLRHNKLVKALENEAIFSSVIDIALGKKKEHVIIKDLQRHPYKSVVMHVDFQRVSSSDVIVKLVPIHFLNEDLCKGVKAGGALFHTMNQLEVRCKVKDLPEFIEVDVANLEKDHVLHLSDLTLPKGVELTVNLEEDEGSHNLPVISVHQHHIEAVETEAPKTAADEVPAQEMKGEGKEEKSEESGEDKGE